MFNPFSRLHCKLQRSSKALRKWSKAIIGNSKLLMAAAKQLIWILDVIQDHRNLSTAEASLHKQLKFRYLGLAVVEKLRARLTFRSRQHMRILNCFFRRINGRQRRNFIHHFSSTEGNLTSQAQMSQHALDPFMNMLGHPMARHVTLNLDRIGLQVNDLHHLEDPFDEEDIHAAVNDLHS